MLGQIDGVGLGYGGGQDAGISKFEQTLNKLMDLLKSLVEAKSEISQKVSEQLKKTEIEMQKYEKLMAKKKTPKLRQKLAQAITQLNQLRTQLQQSQRFDTVAGKNTLKRLAALQSRMEDLKNKLVDAESASRQSDIPLGGDAGPLV